MSTRLAIVQRNQSNDKRTLNEEQLQVPKLEKSQVLVKVEKAALNPTDGRCCQ
jgi:NADPH:quinone reductase-like Zn-dependent oxidoreductase